MLEKAIRIREARRAFRKGHLEEALRVLTAQPLAGHPDALDLRNRVFRELLARAEAALGRGDLPVARHALNTLRAAGHEDENAEVLRERLAAEEKNLGTHDRARKQILSAARQQLASGSLTGVRDKLDSLGMKDAEVRAMKDWFEAKAKDLDRYLTRCRNALQDHDINKARAAQGRAEQLFPTHPEVRLLAAAVSDLEKEEARKALLQAAGPVSEKKHGPGISKPSVDTHHFVTTRTSRVFEHATWPSRTRPPGMRYTGVTSNRRPEPFTR